MNELGYIRFQQYKYVELDPRMERFQPGHLDSNLYVVRTV